MRLQNHYVFIKILGCSIKKTQGKVPCAIVDFLVVEFSAAHCYRERILAFRIP